MRVLLNFIFLLLIANSFFACSETSILEEKDFKSSVHAADYKEIELEILDKINLYRFKMGLNLLSRINIIKSQTESHTKHMIKSNKISYENFSDRCAFLKDKVGAVSIAENTAIGFYSPDALVKSWLDIENSKNNILGDYTHFDISAEQNENGVWYYTNIFIKK